MVNTKEERYEYKILISQNTHLVKLYGKIMVVLEIGNKEIMYEETTEKNAGFVESIKANVIEEIKKEIVNELHEKEQKFVNGLKELEKLGIEIEIY